jgi:predicted RNase H-like HicB family nuclease
MFKGEEAKIKMNLYNSEELTVQYQVFIESHPEKKFIASIVGIPNTTVEGSTKEEVIALAKASLETKLASGELVTIEVDQKRYGGVEPVASLSHQETDPWLKHMGIFASDPTFDDFLAEVASYRQQVDEEEFSE